MSKAGAWLTKSVISGALLGLAAFALSYGFLTIHQELNVRPGFSYWLALVIFVLGTIVGGIYFRVRSR